MLGTAEMRKREPPLFLLSLGTYTIMCAHFAICFYAFPALPESEIETYIAAEIGENTYARIAPLLPLSLSLYFCYNREERCGDEIQFIPHPLQL